MSPNFPLVNPDIRPVEERLKRFGGARIRRVWEFLKEMRVALGTFAKSALETHLGPDIPAAVNTALTYHVDKLSSGRGVVSFPKVAPVAIHDRPLVDVEVDKRVEAALCSDAQRQGVSPTDLAGHAVLVYLAELDRVGGEWTVTCPRRD
jgi:hypothetical protein